MLRDTLVHRPRLTIRLVVTYSQNREGSCHCGIRIQARKGAGDALSDIAHGEEGNEGIVEFILYRTDSKFHRATCISERGPVSYRSNSCKL